MRVGERHALPVRATWAGTWISVSISPVSIAVVSGATKNRSAPSVRVARALASVNRASSATMTAGSSDAGSPCAVEPPSRLW